MIYSFQSKPKSSPKWLDIVVSSNKRKAIGAFRKVKQKLSEMDHRVVSIEVVVQETVIAE